MDSRSDNIMMTDNFDENKQIFFKKGKEFYRRYTFNKTLPKFGDISIKDFTQFTKGFEKAKANSLRMTGHSEKSVRILSILNFEEKGIIINSFSNKLYLIRSISSEEGNPIELAKFIRKSLAKSIKKAQLKRNYYRDNTLPYEATEEGPYEITEEGTIKSIW
jgi:hypothetical protein